MKLKFVTTTLLATALLTACATRVTETPNKVTASDRPFGSYERVLLVAAELVEPFDEQPDNIRAAKRVDLVLAQQIGPVLNDVEVYTAQEVDRMDFSDTNTLLIRPLIKQVKFLNVGKRLLAGPAGGSGVLIMDTAFVDGASGDVLANPGYYRKAGAWSSPFGSADNRMLTEVAEAVAEFTVSNRCKSGERWRRIEPLEDEAASTEEEPTTRWRPTPRECRA